MDAKLAKIYYSPQGYWKGTSAIKKLAEAANVPEDAVKKWLIKQAVWQIYLPALRRARFLVRNLTFRCPTRSSKRTFFFSAA